MNMLPPSRDVTAHPVRLGFLGVGWIGLARMKALLGSGLAEAAAIVDPNLEMIEAAKALSPGAAVLTSLDDLLAHGVDAVVIATPSALHAEQSVAALDAGVAVFCQKPLGRSAAEVGAVVQTARRNDLALGLDLSYRHTQAMQSIQRLMAEGELGRLHTIDLVFHNGYGPDKPWFFDRTLSGGGCLMDLGIHLVDLALWSLDFPRIDAVHCHLKQVGEVWTGTGTSVEDQAYGSLVTEGGTLIRIACSWGQNVGRAADITATFYGTRAAARFANIDGSFYDFSAELLAGTTTTRLFSGTDDWGGRAALDWLEKAAGGNGFDIDALHHVTVAQALDRLYASAAARGSASRLEPVPAVGLALR